PQPFLQRHVATQRNRPSRPALVEVLPSHPFHVRRCGKIHRGARAFLRRDHEPSTEKTEDGNLPPYLRRDDPWMQSVHGDAASREPARKCVREHQVLQLALGIHANVAVAALTLEIVEVESAAPMRTR